MAGLLEHDEGERMMPVARKDHECSLCHGCIPSGERYIYKTITPWCHPDNESFGVYKAHTTCEKLWVDGIGKALDWIFPEDAYEWDEARHG